MRPSKELNWPCRLASAPAPVKFLNLGGGFGIPAWANHGWIWRPSGPTWPPCRRVLARTCLAPSLVIELGRYADRQAAS